MKQLYRIFFTLFLCLLLSIGTRVHAQQYQYPIVEQNSDGSYDQSIVVKTFENYLNNEKNLPTSEDGIDEFVGGFFDKLDIPSDKYLPVIIDENSREINDVEYVELVNKCIKLLKAKVEENKQEQSEPIQEPKVTKLTYKQIAKRVGIGIAIALLIAAIAFLWVKFKKKNKNKKQHIDESQFTNYSPTDTNNNAGTSDVIIRRKTTSVLHKQYLDDVVNDGNYMAINCSDFSNDSAVKTMYIKNTCILDIYNMYAEDLRNPNNPKEDGCMVLGRWVHDEKTDEYVVSLEEVVFPGDDAVFAEYELDFGGKIKVKVNERLRKLRRETNLQYDLTCWVHSHPGLGVFFSNTDCSLHLLHKHPTYSKFLTAIVIDILTPQQELGIFTFKHDMSINAKADLKQLYSLEEWYKWAVESKRNSVFYEEHYNTLENAKARNNGCYNIQLSNSSVIDMDLIAANPNRNGLYFVHGFSVQQSDQTSSIAEKIENSDTMADNELMGCFMVVTHRSYPTIKNAIASYLEKIKFVLVYSIADGMLTSIPVIANELCTDESFYGEQPLEELKIWTRRKR